MTLDALKHEAQLVSCLQWAEWQGWAIAKRGNDRHGPCPVCGGKDRFAINIAKDIWNCRVCGVGGDIIKLVQHTENLRFKEALERITGRKAADPISEKEAEERRKKAEQYRLRKQREDERYRKRAIEAAARIIRQAQPLSPGGPVEQYFRIRGLVKLADAIAQNRNKIWLREIASFKRMVDVSDTKTPNFKEVDQCPAMVGEIYLPGEGVGAAHLTFLDAQAPKGKRQTLHPVTGEVLQAKWIRGSFRGGAIMLFTPKNFDRLVIGEGIETTLSVLEANFEPNTAYWCGASLSGMAGASDSKRKGKDRTAWPDLEARAFVPPKQVKEMVLLRDSDSDAKNTENQLLRCARRAMALRPGISVKLAAAAEGKDFNDMLLEGVNGK